MKTIFNVLTALILAATGSQSLAQGQVVFDNTVQFPSGAPIWMAGQVGIKGPGSAYTAQLALVNQVNGSYTILGGTTFLDAAGGAYLNPVTLDVPLPPGSATTYDVLVWITAAGSYGVAASGAFGPDGWGSSGPFSGTVGGGTLPPTNLDNLQSFSLWVPEPSTFSIVALGAVGIFAGARTRRKFKFN
jgi:hypothetical protein